MDIHIGRVSLQGAKRIVETIYHVDISVAKFPPDPTFTSVVVGIDQTELGELRDRIKYEVAKSHVFHKDDPKAAVIQAIRDDWAIVKNEVVQRLVDEYEYYGDTLTRT